ncbi:MAG: DUF418 domain-containing protein [Gemmatimonadota bacterium]|nr:MAG: DUF418 domain-containing protein [Gemmatimonadota bacterium]
MSEGAAGVSDSYREVALPGRWGPVSGAERIVTLDVLRGVAICGMLLANIIIFALPADSRNVMVEGAAAADQAVALFLGLLVEGKFYTLFSILFGMGLALQSLRAEESRIAFTGLYVRRLIVLLVIGLVHGLLLSAVDILAFYALIAFIALPFRKLEARPLLVTAVALYLGNVIALGVYAQRAPGGALPGEPNWQQLVDERSGPSGQVEEDFRAGSSSGSEMVTGVTLIPLVTKILRVSELELYEFMADEERIFREGTWAEQVRHRAVSYLVVAMSLRLVFLTWRVLALFILGMYFVKRSLFLERDRNLGHYKTIVFSGLVLGLLLELTGGAAQQLSGEYVVAIWVFLIGINLGIPALSLSYAGAVALACARNAGSSVVRSLAALGRAALTNYVGQSVICGLIFYSYGLGLFGRLSGTEALLLAVPNLAGQLVLSVVWLRFFRFGPLEWAWRSLSYWQVQPMRRREAW